MGILDARALAVLGEALDDPDCVVQDDAVAMLTAAGATAVSALASVLIDPGRSWRARSLAATLLGRNGGDEVVAALLRGLGAEHPQIRQSAVRALGRFRDEPLVACALRHARRDVALAVRDAAREVLRQG